MLDNIKIQAINLLVDNKHNVTEIAEICSVSRQTIYNWLENKEFKGSLDRRLQEIQNYGMNAIKANLFKNISNVQHLANKADSEKIRLDANMYLIDRILGKTTTKVDLEAETKQQSVKITDEEIEKAIAELEEE